MTLTASDTSRWRLVVPTLLSSVEIRPDGAGGTERRTERRGGDGETQDVVRDLLGNGSALLCLTRVRFNPVLFLRLKIGRLSSPACCTRGTG